jgi:hypothetical protein
MLGECILIGNSFADIMQAIVFVSAVGFLFLHKVLIEDGRWTFYKYHWSVIVKSRKNSFETFGSLLEKRKEFEKSENARSWKMWFLDNFKQGLSTGMAHIWGTFVAIKISGKSGNDQCGWFLLQYMIDTVIGVVLTLALSKITVFIIFKISYGIAMKWLSIGNYGDEKRHQILFYKIWIIQVFHWLVCSLLARIFCSVVLLIFRYENDKFVDWFSGLWSNKHNELIFVILVIPLIFNTIQFIVQNIFLRWNRPSLSINSFLINSHNENNINYREVV